MNFEELILRVAQKTDFGNRIITGVKLAKESVNSSCIQIKSTKKSLFDRVVEADSETHKGFLTSQMFGNALFIQHERFMDLVGHETSNVQKLVNSGTRNVYADNPLLGLVSTTQRKVTFKDLKISDFAKPFIESLGIGPTKFFLIMSYNPEFMAKITNPEIRKAIQSVKDNCTPTHSLIEAKKSLEKYFSGMKLQNDKVKAGTLGEIYNIIRPDNTEAVYKLMKKDAYEAQLEFENMLFDVMSLHYNQDKRFSRESAERYFNDASSKAMNEMAKIYESLKQELNFFKEAKNNKLLATDATRYSVARITNVSKDGRALIMDKARGIQMNKLVEILQDYKSNPEIFSIKYRDLIKDNPWLSNPQKVMSELQTSILRAFDEQFLFIKKGGKSYMHGDPHSGNFFIRLDEKTGKLIPEFIDTGSVVERSASEIVKDVKFFASYFTGNSKGVAEYFVEMSNIPAKHSEIMIKRLSEDIEQNIFSKKQNITNFDTVLKNINVMLGKYGFSLKSENATAMKAQLQFLSVAKQAGELSGKSCDIKTIMKDIPKAIYLLQKNGVSVKALLKDTLRFCYYNQKRVASTMTQFFIKLDNLPKLALPPAPTQLVIE